MDLRARVGVSTSWEATVEPRCVLYIKSSSEILLDEPYPSEQLQQPILTHPSPLSPSSSEPHSSTPPPCYVHLDLSRLGGYALTSLSLISSARTMEVYGGNGGVCEGEGGVAGGEYVGTARGGFVRNTEDGFKLYCCEADLPLQEVYSEISLKLLSLRGRTEVRLERLELIVTEDHSGTAPGRTVSEESVSSPCVDMEQLLSSLPTQNLPPSLSSLLSSLQCLQVHPSPVDARCTPRPAMPPELAQLTSVLREMRPAPPVVAENIQPPSDIEKEPDVAVTMTIGGSEEEELDVAQDSQSLDAIEQRLRGYIDAKFAALQRQIDERFERLMEDVLCKVNVATVNGGLGHSHSSQGKPRPTEHSDQSTVT